MAQQTATTAQTDLMRTGLPGLDRVIGGGLSPHRAYLIRGGPGAGKTILGWHFLTAEPEEEALFVTLGEPTDQLKAHARKLGFPADRVEFLDLSPSSTFFTEEASYDIFHPDEVERGPATDKITAYIEEVRPDRIFVDSMTQFRYLAAGSQQFRKQSQAFLRYLKEQEATVLFSSESSEETPDEDLQFIADGVLELRAGPNRRSIAVTKLRGHNFRYGPHSAEITSEGLTVYPQLLPEDRRTGFDQVTLSSGVPELDELLGGGVDRGTISLISAPSGAGKTTLGLQFMKEAAGRGERSVVYNFEEEVETLVHRCENVNIPVRKMIERDMLAIKNVRPWTFLEDQFTHQIRREVEERDTRLIMIDSVKGLAHSVEERDLTRYLHTLGKYLVDQGVTLILISEIENITGEFRATESTVSSYLADNLIFLRYLEMEGQMRKAIGVLKQRTGQFEKTLREFRITSYGIKVGEPLTNLRGILQGTPEWAAPDQRPAATNGQMST